MTGNIVNFSAILVGSVIGLLFKSKIPQRINNIMVEGLGLGIIIYGISQGIKTINPLIIFASLAIGAIIGEIIDIEKKLNHLGEYFQNKMKKSKNVAQGFVTASLLFCVGAMAIMGALQSGLQGEHDILFAKAFLDGTISVIFSSAMGVGVILSSITVFVYQGIIIVLSGMVKPYLAVAVINEMTAVGGVLICGIGLNMLEIKKFKLGNLIPAVFIPIIIHIIFPFS
ncbi:MAG: DUF554 domain-containing protein [Eubacteriales bacterium]